jgi:acetyl esterase/lipase
MTCTSISAGLLAVFASVPLSALGNAAGAETPPLAKTSHTYKVVDGLPIQADVYRRNDPNQSIRPVVVWIHGGALIVGNRGSVPPQLLELARDEDYVLISIDYRLAPEVKSPAIIEDVRDAFRWIRETAPDVLRIDPRRMVVAGGSAGGYLTMMTGWCVKPRPTALVAYWGYGDVDGDWLSQPSAYYRDETPAVDRDTALAAVGRGALAGTETPESQQARGQYYRYLRQQGLWTREVTGFDPATQRKELDALCPVRNITADYPPILMIHGTADTDVPYEKSADMAAELSRHNVPHELVTVAGAGHGLSGGDPEEIAAAHARVAEFIRDHLK